MQLPPWSREPGRRAGESDVLISPPPPWSAAHSPGAWLISIFLLYSHPHIVNWSLASDLMSHVFEIILTCPSNIWGWTVCWTSRGACSSCWTRQPGLWLGVLQQMEYFVLRDVGVYLHWLIFILVGILYLNVPFYYHFVVFSAICSVLVSENWIQS